MGLRLAFITPTKWINQFGKQGDFQLGLAHLLNRELPNDYEKALLSTGQDIILDNGLYELHQPEGIDSLLQKAMRIKATHFFAPDYLYNAEKTKAALFNTIYVKNLSAPDFNIKLGAVVQGSNEEEWLKQYDEFQEIPEIDLIGLSILSIPRCFRSSEAQKETGAPYSKQKKSSLRYIHNDNEITPSRVKCLKTLLERGNNKKRCHLLGVGSGYEDLIFAKNNCPFVVSNDSSSCFQSGLFYHDIQPATLRIDKGKVQQKVNFNLTFINPDQEITIQQNINNVKKILQ